MCLCSSWHGSAVLSDTQFLIHGGYNGNNALSDTFIFDTGERQLTVTLQLCTHFCLLGKLFRTITVFFVGVGR